jgi:hypothetical protein
LAWQERAKRPESIEHVFPETGATQEGLGDALSLGCRWNVSAGLSTGQILLPVTSATLPPVHWDDYVVSAFPDVAIPAASLFNVIVLGGQNEKIAALTRPLFLARGFVFDPSIGDALLTEEFLIRAELDSTLIESRETENFHFCKTCGTSPASESDRAALSARWPFFAALSRSRLQKGVLTQVIPRLMRICRKFRHVTEMGIGDGEGTVALIHCLSNVASSLRTYSEQDSPDIRRLVSVQRQIDWKFEVFEATSLPEIEETDVLFFNLPPDSCRLREALQKFSEKVSAVIVVPHTAFYGFLDKRGKAGLESAINKWLAENAQWSLWEREATASGYTVMVRKTSQGLLADMEPKRGVPEIGVRNGPLINIVTRTSGRPLFFNRLCHSIRGQSYSFWRHVVVHERPDDLSYISAVPRVSAVSCDLAALWEKYPGPHFSDERFWEARYNLLCNSGMRACTEGWVLFVDDDDTLFDKDTLLKLVQHLDDEDTLVIHRFQFEDGRQVPPDLLFERRQLALHGIGTGCFTFHSKWRNYVRWDAYKCADYRFIAQLATVVPKIKWLNQTVVAMSTPGLGRRIDLV